MKTLNPQNKNADFKCSTFYNVYLFKCLSLELKNKLK